MRRLLAWAAAAGTLLAIVGVGVAIGQAVEEQQTNRQIHGQLEQLIRHESGERQHNTRERLRREAAQAERARYIACRQSGGSERECI